MRAHQPKQKTKRAAEKSRTRRLRPGLVLLLLALTVRVWMVFMIRDSIYRYRLALAPLLIVCGSYFLVWSWRRIAAAESAQARWRAVLLPGALAVGAAVAFGSLLPFLPRQYYCRTGTYQIAANFYAQQNRLTQARREIESLVRCVEQTGAPIDLTEHREKIRQLKDAGH